MASLAINSKSDSKSKSPEDSLFSRSDVLGAKLKHSPNTDEPHPCFKICDYDPSRLTNKKLEVLLQLNKKLEVLLQLNKRLEQLLQLNKKL